MVLLLKQTTSATFFSCVSVGTSVTKCILTKLWILKMSLRFVVLASRISKCFCQVAISCLYRRLTIHLLIYSFIHSLIHSVSTLLPSSELIEHRGIASAVRLHVALSTCCYSFIHSFIHFTAIGFRREILTL
jgi:ABC-type uncharacterized transport system permease subunit